MEGDSSLVFGHGDAGQRQRFQRIVSQSAHQGVDVGIPVAVGLDLTPGLGIIRRGVQAERFMNDSQRSRRLRLRDKRGNLDFACRDHVDIHFGIGQGAEHLRSNVGLCCHIGSDDRDLGDLFVVRNALGADTIHH